MRLWHLVLIVGVAAIVLAIARDAAGRVALIVFVFGLGVVACALGATLALFQTLGALGAARTASAHLEALAASAVVLALGSAATLGLIAAAVVLVQWSVP